MPITRRKKAARAAANDVVETVEIQSTTTSRQTEPEVLEDSDEDKYDDSDEEFAIEPPPQYSKDSDQTDKAKDKSSSPAYMVLTAVIVIGCLILFIPYVIIIGHEAMYAFGHITGLKHMYPDIFAPFALSKNDSIHGIASYVARVSLIDNVVTRPQNSEVAGAMLSQLNDGNARLDALKRQIDQLEEYSSQLVHQEQQRPTALGSWKTRNFQLAMHMLNKGGFVEKLVKGFSAFPDYSDLRADVENIRTYWFNRLPPNYVSHANFQKLYDIFLQRLASIYHLHIKISELEEYASEMFTYQRQDTNDYDHASLLSGAVVFSTDGSWNLCAESISDSVIPQMDGKWTGNFPLDFHQYLLQVIKTGRPNSYDYANFCPELALLPGRNPRQCWGFEEFPGKMYIAFPVPVHITGFTLEHVNFSLTDHGNMAPAPQTFAVYGITGVELKQQQAFEEHPLQELGRYVYNAKNGAAKQRFMLDAPTTEPYHGVYLQVTSNHRSVNSRGSYSCLYRFRVHGEASMRT